MEECGWHLNPGMNDTQTLNCYTTLYLWAYLYVYINQKSYELKSSFKLATASYLMQLYYILYSRQDKTLE